MALYWIVATKEEPMRLVELVEREDGLDGKICASGGAPNEQTLMLVGDGIVDPRYVKIRDGALVNDNARRIADAWARLRAERNAKLASCDWTQVNDSPLDTEAKAAWAAYRQALRDLPENVEDPEGEITWPSEPE